MNFVPSGDSLFGVLEYLNRKSPVLYPHLVTAVASSTYIANGWGSPYVVLNHGSNKGLNENNWCSLNSPNPYITIHFPIHSLFLTHYSIMTFNISSGNLYGINSWRVDCSNDTIYWNNLHSVSESTSLHSIGIIKTFPTSSNDICHHIKITMTSQTTNPSSWNFILASIEFFGTFYGVNNFYNSCSVMNSSVSWDCCLFQLSLYHDSFKNSL